MAFSRRIQTTKTSRVILYRLLTKPRSGNLGETRGAYPMKGYSRIHMLYRFGASSFGTIAQSSRFIEAYRHPSLEFVVSQSPWFEGEAKFADLVLPACTSLERWDIAEWANCGGYVHHSQGLVNHRVAIMQHKCIDPLGESRSDYEIFATILTKMGLGALYTEGCTELDWCKRVFDSSDIAQHVKWKDFVRKGYYVLPAAEEKLREPPYFRWYAEGRTKDVPEPMPMPSQYAEEFGKGLQTYSGKIEFVASSIALGDPANPERPALNRYISPWEGPNTPEATRYPLQMISVHPRYSFHTHSDGKGSAINDIPDHRVLIDGHYYWVANLNPLEAERRGIRHHSLVRLFNDRGSVICAADISSSVMPGVVKTYESSAEFRPVSDPGDKVVDVGGCVNVLTPSRPQMHGTDAMAANSCMVEAEPWTRDRANLADMAVGELPSPAAPMTH